MQLQKWNKQPDNDIQGSGTASGNGSLCLLDPFAAVLTQADKTVTISCVIPTVLTLHCLLIEQQPSVTYHPSSG